MELRNLLIAGASAIVLSVGYVGARCYSTSGGIVTSQDLSYRLAIEEEAMRGQVMVAETPVLRVREGDRVNLLLTAPLPAEVYIHGLETSATLLPNLETSLAFYAATPGRYYVHLHNVVCADPHESSDSHVEVAVIEVEPR
ncbi:MAG: hypothetical protein E6G85_30960 [Alphaproteobacteria bacterium]|nr:MAG: hypothetical protein E6G85_30960 [Alphaproteobacteria bacterium]